MLDFRESLWSRPAKLKPSLCVGQGHGSTSLSEIIGLSLDHMSVCVRRLPHPLHGVLYLPPVTVCAGTTCLLCCTPGTTINSFSLVPLLPLCCHCVQRFVHDWPSCPFAHPGEKAKRRDPRIHQYDCEMCPAVLKGETCELGVSCPHSHHVFESWLHVSSA